uniref:Uncharacterized protein n=1 Tax=Trichogramma kaykai TaxID=54128 RepID=A0ABD2XE98_9HYME
MAIGVLEAEAGRRGAGLRHRPGSHRPTANDAENTPQATHCDDYSTRRFDDYPDVRDNDARLKRTEASTIQELFGDDYFYIIITWRPCHC